jgi:hypothetical protein
MTPEFGKKIEHFQNINASNVTNIVNTLLGLGVGLIAYAVNIVVNAKAPLAGDAKCWMIASCVFLSLEATVAITIMFTRLEDYRNTIKVTAMADAFPNDCPEDERLKRIDPLEKRLNRLNLTTNVLLYVLPALFIVGSACLTISIFITNASKLR